MNQLRQSMLADTEITANKSRFGLFTQPPPLAVGDDSYAISKIARKGQDGKPITKPRNLLAGPNKSGVTQKDFITPSSSIHAGDKYVNPQKLQRQSDLKIHSKAQFHQLQFKPSNGHKSLISASYRHIDEKPTQKKKPARDPDTGRVITQNTNINANPMKKIEGDFFKPLKHIADPYERKELFETQQKKVSHSKMGQQIYRTMSHGDILFSNNRRIYGEDNKTKELMKSRKTFVESASKMFNHQTKFKLARRGHGDPISRYPEFLMPVETNKSEIVKKVKKQKSEKDQWKPNGNRSISRPTPSISYSSFSLRKYY